MPPEKISYLEKRLGNTLLATQILALASAFNAYFMTPDSIQEQVPHFLNLRVEVVIYVISGLLIIPLIRKISHTDIHKASVYYFWLLAIVTAMITLLEGGLQSVPIMAFPIIAIFSALHAERKVFLSIGAFFCVMVIAMAVNHHFGWFTGIVTSGWARMVDCLIIVSISSYVAWVLGSDTERSLSNLKQEHQHVLESKILIQHLADTDSLTGLANRTFAKTRFEAMQAELEPDSQEIGMYFVDLDNFKSINDLFDHQVGDELLKIIGTRLSRLIDSSGVVCRLGGDEFALFIKVNKSFDYDSLAQEILISLSEPHAILGARAEITASIGITVVKDRDINFDNTRKQADMAMYKSKQAGKNDYRYYSEDLHQDYMKNLNILNALKNALNKNMFDLHFQPKVNIKTQKVVGAEALLRWNRKNPDNLTPGDFIPVIESTELIHDIGAWVVQQACIECSLWHNEGHKITVAVNVSALQLTRIGFYEIVANALSTSGLDAEYLEIELTEHSLIQENSTIKTQLNALKKLGIHLSIDDFGTGYSNMGYLTTMEVDTLKLDKSFISEIENSSDSLAIVTAINGMAGVLGMNVVAEGVEKESERKVLESIGCDIGQGYLWSKALPSPNFLSYVALNKPVLVPAC